ncbi:hypothetical protein BEUL_0469 [Bifidobacterium eulemuris]|uniref:Uncharacterized protein n=1 Tax=Bifidobacterium eulemuris TaxID=1765219 RepID=A0A261GCU3_9BIFI|nr:hypothetical protein BEUL_0469 [Bifidobacterium eulemuris]
MSGPRLRSAWRERDIRSDTGTRRRNRMMTGSDAGVGLSRLAPWLDWGLHFNETARWETW